MKNYIKPELETLNIAPLSDIAEGGIGNWLDGNGLNADTNITVMEFTCVS